MSKRDVISVVGIFVVLALFGTLPRYIARQATRPNVSDSVALAKFTDQQYVDVATKNCSKVGELSESECRCIYSKLIGEFGKSYVYDFDKTADDPNRPFTNREIEIVRSCI